MITALKLIDQLIRALDNAGDKDVLIYLSVIPPKTDKLDITSVMTLIRAPIKEIREYNGKIVLDIGEFEINLQRSK